MEISFHGRYVRALAQRPCPWPLVGFNSLHPSFFFFSIFRSSLSSGESFRQPDPHYFRTNGLAEVILIATFPFLWSSFPFVPSLHDSFQSSIVVDPPVLDGILDTMFPPSLNSRFFPPPFSPHTSSTVQACRNLFLVKWECSFPGPYILFLYSFAGSFCWSRFCSNSSFVNCHPPKPLYPMLFFFWDLFFQASPRPRSALLKI